MLPEFEARTREAAERPDARHAKVEHQVDPRRDVKQQVFPAECLGPPPIGINHGHERDEAVHRAETSVPECPFQLVEQPFRPTHPAQAQFF